MRRTTDGLNTMERDFALERLQTILRSQKENRAIACPPLPNGVVVVIVPQGIERNFKNQTLADEFVFQYNNPQ